MKDWKERIKGIYPDKVPPWCRPGAFVVLKAGHCAQRVEYVKYSKLITMGTLDLVTTYGGRDQVPKSFESKGRDYLDYRPANYSAMAKSEFGSKYAYNSHPRATLSGWWGYQIDQAYAGNCCHDTNQPTKETTMTQEKTLYTWTDASGTKFFGHLLAEDTDGYYVMKTMGTNEAPVVVKPADVTEVTPYTVEISSMDEGRGSAYHVRAAPGSVKVGDFVLLNRAHSCGRIVTISRIDTKNKNASGRLEGVKLVTKAIKQEDEPAETKS